MIQNATQNYFSSTQMKPMIVVNQNGNGNASSHGNDFGKI